MNKLDGHISLVQILVLCSGVMSVYTMQMKSPVVSWILAILCISIAVVAGVIIILKAGQFLTKGGSPGSWSFDIFLDFHGGLGACTVRSLAMLLQDIVQKSKFIYDLDFILQGRGLGVVYDAVKL